MSVNEKMTAIADAIREKTGKTETLGLDAMAKSVGEVYDAGKQEALAEHFRCSLLGNGTTALRVAIPFEPDIISISSIAPYSVTAPLIMTLVTMDGRSASRYGGRLGYVASQNKPSVAPVTTASIKKYCTYEDGVFCADFNAATKSVWAENVRYTVVAAKFPEETAKALVVEEVSLLPDGSSGTLEYNQSRIDELFTADEWATLIAAKPNWTFSML